VTQFPVPTQTCEDAHASLNCHWPLVHDSRAPGEAAAHRTAPGVVQAFTLGAPPDAAPPDAGTPPLDGTPPLAGVAPPAPLTPRPATPPDGAPSPATPPDGARKPATPPEGAPIVPGALPDVAALRPAVFTVPLPPPGPELTDVAPPSLWPPALPEPSETLAEPSGEQPTKTTESVTSSRDRVHCVIEDRRFDIVSGAYCRRRAVARSRKNRPLTHPWRRADGRPMVGGGSADGSVRAARLSQHVARDEERKTTKGS
jgi:hypothetical protein